MIKMVSNHNKQTGCWIFLGLKTLDPKQSTMEPHVGNKNKIILIFAVGDIEQSLNFLESDYIGKHLKISPIKSP